MAQVGFPRLFLKWGSPDSRWDMAAHHPSSLGGVQAAKTANAAYIALMSHEGTGAFPFPAVTYGGNTFEVFGGATDNVVDGGAANAGVIRPFSSFWDFLYNANGVRAGINGGGSGHFGWNLANFGLSIGIEHTWQALGRYILYRLKQNRLYRDLVWDGYYSDNWIYSIGAGWFYGGSLDTDRNGGVDAGATLRGRWGDGLNALAQYLAAALPGKTIGGNGLTKADSREGTWVANHTDKNGWHKWANFAEIEDGEAYLYSHAMAQRLIDVCMSTDSSVDPTTGSSRLGWLNYPDPHGRERYVAIFFQLQDDAGNYLATPANFNSPSVYKQELYYRPARKGMALACCAGGYYWPLFVQNHASKLYYDDEMLGGSGFNQRHWMGQPLGAATSPVSGCFIRQFTNGLAVVNVTGSPITFVLPGGANTWRKIAGTASHNDGATITTSTFTIPAHDGRLLVRLGGPPPVLAPVNATLPTITGSAQQGQVLTPSAGTWLNTPTTYAYTWARYSADGQTRLATLQTESIPVATTPATYTLVAGDVGFTIRLELTATNATGSGSAISAPTGVIGAPASVVAFEGPPSAIFDFTIASTSLPSSVFPASTIFDFTIGAPRLVNVARTTATTRTGTGERRVGEGGGG